MWQDVWLVIWQFSLLLVMHLCSTNIDRLNTENVKVDGILINKWWNYQPTAFITWLQTAWSIGGSDLCNDFFNWRFYRFFSPLYYCYCLCNILKQVYFRILYNVDKQCRNLFVTKQANLIFSGVVCVVPVKLWHQNNMELTPARFNLWWKDLFIPLLLENHIFHYQVCTADCK